MLLDIFIYFLIFAMFTTVFAANIVYYRHRRSLTPEQRAAEDAAEALYMQAW